MNLLFKYQLRRFSKASITTTDTIHHKTCLKKANKLFDLNKLVIFSDFDYTITNKYGINPNKSKAELNSIYTTFSIQLHTRQTAGSMKPIPLFCFTAAN